MSLTAQEQRLLVEYSAIFRVNASDYGEQDEEAYVILAHLYGLFAIEGTYDRQRYRNAVLQETAAKFGQTTRFFGKIQTVAADDAAGLRYYPQRKSNEDLIQEFKYLLIGLTALTLLGVGPALGSARRGVEESIRTNSVRAGLARARTRLLQGAGSGIIEAITQKVVTRFPIGAVLVAAAVLAFYAMEVRMSRIRETMTERYEADLATEDELEEIRNSNFHDIMQEILDAYW